MREINYVTRVERRRGKWRVSVPALPRDAPVIVTTQLGNAAPLLIEQLGAYLGVSVSMIGVEIEAPRAKRRPRLRDRLTASYVQLLGGAVALGGLYVLAGYAVTLIATGAAAATLGALREAGKI